MILERLAELGFAVLDGFFPPNYPEAALARLMFGLDSSRKRPSQQTIATILWRLKKEGLVERVHIFNKSGWRLTQKGNQWRQSQKRIPVFSAPHDGIRRLVIFDVPERERRKRDALRGALIACNYRQLQKSVWMGECPLPGDLIDLIDTLGLAKHIHIFSVQQQGTLE